MTKRAIIPILMIATWCGGARAETSVKALMKDKLDAAHGVLEGIATGDFAKVESFATRLREISRATSWHKSESTDFQLFAKSFQNSAEFLAERAKDKDIEGISMGYIRMTLDCIRCHNVLRPGKVGR